MFHTQTNLKN